jgi:hypothetical protein
MTKEIASSWDSDVNSTDLTTGGQILSANVATFIPRNQRIYSRSGQHADGLYWPDGLILTSSTTVQLYAVTAGEGLADGFIADPVRLKGAARKITFDVYGKDYDLTITTRLFNSATASTFSMTNGDTSPVWESYELTVPANAQLVTIVGDVLNDGPGILYQLAWRETILQEADL